MDLRDWNTKLYKHFNELRRARPVDKPVFALEHGLNHEDVAALESDIRRHIRLNLQNPAETEHPIRSNPNTESGENDHAIR